MEKDQHGHVEGVLQELGRKIDELIAEAKGASGEIRDDLEEKIKEFKEKKWKLEEEYERFKTKNEGKWDDIKLHLSNAALEIERAVQAAFKKRQD